MENDKPIRAMTPRMRALLEGGGATSFFGQQKVALAKSPEPVLGKDLSAEGNPSPVQGIAAQPLPVLGQAQTPQQQAAPPPVTKCPGPVQLPDGRILEPDDYIKLNDLCEIMPYLIRAMAASMAPGQQVKVAGGITGVQGVGQGAGLFGGLGPLGPYGASSAGGFGGGGGGTGPRGSQGPAGATGPQGPAGPGCITEDPVIKTDGDFAVGPGAFVPVPGTNISFTLSEAGIAKIEGIITLGDAAGSQIANNAQIGLRIDGVDYPVNTRLLHTLAGGVGEFLLGQNFVYPISLAAGAHTVELLIRGLNPGEYGGGLGGAAGVCANATIPLILTVSHS